MITINFTGAINNDSLQVGDYAYFITPSISGGFQQTITDPTFIGDITDIGEDFIIVDDSSGTAPGPDDFIMFAKDSSINISGLVGYFAEVEIKNNSKEKAEMFSISSEITVSSK